MRRLTLLAPSLSSVPSTFVSAELNPSYHSFLLSRLQRLRGKLYVQEGAIECRQLTTDGRHQAPADELGWHLLSLQENSVMGSARLQVHSYEASFADLAVSRCPQARAAIWGARLRNAVGLEMEKAQHAGLRLIEAGGWVLAPELRATKEALRIALGGYAMGALLGGALGLCMATFRHHSAGILRRLGASALVWHGLEIPPFYDPVYRCEMQVLRFDSGAPSPKFKKWVDRLQNELKAGTVFCSRLDRGDGESLKTLDRAIYDREYKAAAEYSFNGKWRLVDDKTKQIRDAAPTKGR